jgi:membrane protein
MLSLSFCSIKSMDEKRHLRPRRLRGMRWVWHLGGLSIRELTLRVYNEIEEDDVFGRAAQLSYYFFFSLFPLLIFAAGIAGHALGSDPALYAKLLDYVYTVMPTSAYQIIRDALNDITTGSAAGKLSFGVVVALWSGSAGMVSVIEGLNRAYGIREFRPWWKRRLVAIGLTMVVLIVSACGLFTVLIGGRAEQWILDVTGAARTVTGAWLAIQWVLALFFMLVVFNLIYLFAPNLKEQRWQAIMPGSWVALVGWVLSTGGFKLYLTYYDSVSKTYGTLGAVIVLLLWLYITGAAILIGGEVNSEIMKAAAAAGAAEAQKPQEGH